MKKNEKASDKIKKHLLSKKLSIPVIILLIAVTIFSPQIDSVLSPNVVPQYTAQEKQGTGYTVKYRGEVYAIPPYANEPFVVLNNNVPLIDVNSLKDSDPYEFYGPLDDLGRCTQTEAVINKELMPTKERESISSVKPSGWNGNNNEYDWVDGKYIYNRCHLIGFQLTGENANKENLITGTRYLNVDGMLPFENMVADYIKETGNRVFYRVTPIFIDDDLVPIGVIMEAFSVEDNGEGISFNVFCYNNQPGVEIDYHTGNNWAIKK